MQITRSIDAIICLVLSLALFACGSEEEPDHSPSNPKQTAPGQSAPKSMIGDGASDTDSPNAKLFRPAEDWQAPALSPEQAKLADAVRPTPLWSADGPSVGVQWRIHNDIDWPRACPSLALPKPG